MSDSWTAAEVRDALRRRYPAAKSGHYVGQWTCLEEYANIDLLALNSWNDADVIGFEVKVSRSDMRQELLNPKKRGRGIEICTQFYFAVPEGLLKPDEIAFDEPEWELEDYDRQRCPGVPTFGPEPEYIQRRRKRGDWKREAGDGRYGGVCAGHYRQNKMRQPYRVNLPLPMVVDCPTYVPRPGRVLQNDLLDEAIRKERDRQFVLGYVEDVLHEAEQQVVCPVCGGRGYLAKSRVETESPTLWVPRGCGLIEVGAHGAHIVKFAPKRPDAFGLLWSGGAYSNIKIARQHANQVARWASNRPDPRHVSQGREHEMYEGQAV